MVLGGARMVAAALVTILAPWCVTSHSMVNHKAPALCRVLCCDGVAGTSLVARCCTRMVAAALLSALLGRDHAVA